MSETPSGSASGSTTPKGIGSLARKQSDVTRQGTQKLKFTPVLPARRKKDEVKPEPAASSVPEASDASTRGRGRGRGRGGTEGSGRGRGRGRGGAAPPLIEMTASGPFAMGPALAGSQHSRRSASHTDRSFTGLNPANASAALGQNLTRTAAPSLKALEKGKVKVKEEEEVYSDPDEGVEIIDMNNIKDMDWMAPETLRDDKSSEKARRKKEKDAVDLKNALDLSESEGEEELEDLIEDFAVRNDLEDADSALRADNLYFFQFPSPFPRFTKQNPDAPLIELPEPGPEQVPAQGLTKKVSFAPDTKPAATPSSSRPSTAPPTESTGEEPVDGVIGQLEVYKSGAVKIRLVNGTLLDVNAATQPSFLQQAVYLDLNNKHLTVLGEVNKQFVVSPDIDTLLEAMERKEEASGGPGPLFEGADELLSMDTT